MREPIDTPPDDRDPTKDELHTAILTMVDMAEDSGLLKKLAVENSVIRYIIRSAMKEEYDQILMDVMKDNDDKKEDDYYFED